MEVKNVVFDLSGDGAPGPDGFGGFFYQHFWDILGSDVILSVQEFFWTGALPQNFNSTMLILITKVPGPSCLRDYRPIALANFQFKIVTKNLADRLAIITIRIVSINQWGFIRERNIADCVIIAFEAINLLDRKTHGGNLALKVDIKKTFDTLDWNFLIHVLLQFDFGHALCLWITAILNLVRLSISVNGTTTGFFPCTQGVLQGDPLLPLLFCLAEEVLSRALTIEQENGWLVPMQYCRDCDIPTHVLYGDDILIFCKGSKTNVRRLLPIFTSYSEASRQLINASKSRFFTSSMKQSRASSLGNLLGFSAGFVPFQYLGFPIFVGKPRCSHFQPIMDRIKVKLAT